MYIDLSLITYTEFHLHFNLKSVASRESKTLFFVIFLPMATRPHLLPEEFLTVLSPPFPLVENVWLRHCRKCAKTFFEYLHNLLF